MRRQRYKIGAPIGACSRLERATLVQLQRVFPELAGDTRIVSLALPIERAYRRCARSNVTIGAIRSVARSASQPAATPLDSRRAKQLVVRDRLETLVPTPRAAPAGSGSGSASLQPN